MTKIIAKDCYIIIASVIFFSEANIQAFKCSSQWLFKSVS